MRYLKISLISLASVLFLLIISTAFLPSRYVVEMEFNTTCSSELMFHRIQELKSWKTWSAWNYYADTTVHTTFPGGNTAGRLGMMQVIGKNFGTVTIKNSEVIPGKLIKQEFIFEDSRPITYSYMRFRSENGKTIFTWKIEGRTKRDPFEKIYALWVPEKLKAKMKLSFDRLSDLCKVQQELDRQEENNR